MLQLKQKSKIITEFRVHEKDSGSAPVQIALLTSQIGQLTKHLKKHPKDNHSRRGLLNMVSKRKKLLDYLNREDEKIYQKITKELNLRK